MKTTGNLNDFNTLTLKLIFRKTQTLFKKLGYCFLVESTKIDNITFPYKTALSEPNVKTNRMGCTKLTYHKEQSFASNHFPLSKILFQFRYLVCRDDMMYQPPKCPYAYFSKVLEFSLACVFPVSILKIDLNATKISNVQDYVCTKN